MEELGYPQNPMIVRTDSANSIQSTAKLISSEEAKHYDVRIKEIKQLRDEGIIDLVKVNGKDNPADLMTAQRPRVQFDHLIHIAQNHGKQDDTPD